MTYFTPKASQTEKEEKAPYIMHWAHTLPRTDPRTHFKPDNFIQIVSIDPGTVNFAIRIERRYFSGKIVPIFYQVWALRKRGKVDTARPNTIYSTLSGKLDEIKDSIIESHLFIIEKQLAINYQSTRVMQHAISHFIILVKDLPHYPIIYEIAPTLKGQCLGAPPRMSKNELKEWAIVKAKELLTIRGDTWSLQVIDKYKKQDDLGDIVCQIEAFLIFIGEGPLTAPPIETQVPIQNKIIDIQLVDTKNLDVKKIVFTRKKVSNDK